MTADEFLKAYGHRSDTAVKRKALAEGRVPESLVAPLEEAIEASGISLEQTARGWIGAEVFEALRTQLDATKRK